MGSRSSDKKDIPNTITEFLKKQGMASDRSTLVAGVSGGLDSMVMLYVLAVSLQYRVVAAHVNYGKRGEDSDADESLVRSFCARYDIPLEVHHVKDNMQRDTGGETILDTSSGPVSERDDAIVQPSGNFQEHARQVRRAFFRSVMQEHKAEAVFQAHHRDDQLETIFQKILRGAALEKWSGMKAVDGYWMRPLLPFFRTDLLDFAGKHEIPYRTDASNMENDYTRNLLRNDIFPRLEPRFPGWRANIERVSELASLHEELLDYVTTQVIDAASDDPAERSRQAGTDPANDAGKEHGYDRMTVKGGRLNRSRWLDLPAPLRIPIARNWIRKQTGFTGWSRGGVSRLEDLVHLQTGRKIPVSDRYSILRDRDHFVIVTTAPASQNPESSIHPQESFIHPQVSRYVSQVLELPDISGKPVEMAGLRFSISTYLPDVKTGILQLNREKLPSELQLRNWMEGDRIRSLGLKGEQLISDLLTNRKISAQRKNESLVLVSFDGIVHAVIFPHSIASGEIGTISEQTRCHSAGQRILLIQKTDPTT